jgi:LacI family transcriptional regulator
MAEIRDGVFKRDTMTDSTINTAADLRLPADPDMSRAPSSPDPARSAGLAAVSAGLSARPTRPAPGAGLKRIAVMIGSSLAWREKVMRGIAGFAHEHGPWHVYTAPEGTEDSLFFSENYRWDGLVVRIVGPRLARRLAALKVPAVAIGSARVAGPEIPRVKVDDEHLMRPVVRHLVAGGLRSLAYCSFFPSRQSDDRGPALERVAAEAGCTCTFYCEATKLTERAPWQARQRDLSKWLKRLEKPVGVVAWNADVACQVIEACHAAGLRCPDEVAVVSADEDEAKCNLASPTVSAIEIPAQRIGYEAAALLSRMMDGHTPPAEPVMIEPTGVVTVRESSDTSHLADRDVHRAARYLRDRLADPITISDAADHVGVSRRWLERRFRLVLGRTPHEELRAARLEHAKRLLLETDWPAAKVARASGLTSPAYLNHVFRRETGLTPAAFRRRHRLA